MSDYKPETLPGGVLIRKIKNEEGKFVLSSMGQALIVTNLDIAAMYGLAYPEEQVNTEKAWHDVSQKLTQNQADTSTAYESVVLRIAGILANIGSRKLIKEAKAALRNDLIEKLISGWDDCARAMVAEITLELIIYAFESVEMYKEIEPNGGHFTNYLIRRGLIPASVQEGGSDE